MINALGEAFAMAAEDAEFREDEEPAAPMAEAAPWIECPSPIIRPRPLFDSSMR
jgi:hypothetical protein